MSTLGFIPPPVAPLVPVAANAIVPTGGLLAGAVAGAKAGAALGPKGLLAGAVVGGALGLLLLTPEPVQGTRPNGLDPGLDDPNAKDRRRIEVTVEPSVDPSTGQLIQTWFSGTVWIDQKAKEDCSTGDKYPGRLQSFDQGTSGIRANQMTVKTGSTSFTATCDPLAELKTAMVFQLIADGRVLKQAFAPDGVGYQSGRQSAGGPDKAWIEGAKLENAEGTFVPEPVRNPRPQPFSPSPLVPTTVPEPATVPVPDPEPQPEPLRVPTPDDPTAPPVTIPKVPPAVPRTPTRKPATPSPVPVTPTIPQIVPTPAPSIPPVREPSPAPKPAPAPAPGPVPQPGPVPVPVEPGVVPEPSPLPLPVPVPSPQPVKPAPVPDTSRPTLPDSSIAPSPKPEVVTTPKDAHFPVKGAPPVTSGGARPSPTAIANELGRVENKLAQVLNGQSKIDIPLGPILYLLEQILGNQEQEFPGTTYLLEGVCETPDDEGNQPVFSTPIGVQPGLEAVITRVDALQYLLQAHLGYKTPTCTPEKLPIEGDYRTISFRSDETSPFGKSRLRKRFKYRSQSGLDLGAVVDHWKDFTFTGGPVCVKHTGSSLGSPQVWATSIDEGKRVIRHAGGEAGIDPDQVGQWRVGGSDNPRYGVSDTMRVDTTGGYYWITARDGSDGRPIVAR